jgi:hypothetical protein
VPWATHRPSVSGPGERSSAGSRRARPRNAAEPAANRTASAGQGARPRFRANRRAALLILYFDTSAAVKLVIAEEGSELASALWAAPHPRISSILAYPEGRAALAAARRGDRLAAGAQRRALEHFESLHDELSLIGIDV